VKVQVVRESTDLPYTILVYGVTEGTFDGSVDEGTKAELIRVVMLVPSPARRRHEDVYSFSGDLTAFCSDSKGLGKVIASGKGIVHLATRCKFPPAKRRRAGKTRCLSRKAPTGLVRVIGLAVMDVLRKMLIWIAIAAVVILAISLPVIVATGMFGGKPLAGTVALIGLVLLAFGVAWYVRSRGAGI
jgi:hypothetical protein